MTYEKIHSMIDYKVGQILEDVDTNHFYEVVKVINMKLISDKKGYGITIKRIEPNKSVGE